MQSLLLTRCMQAQTALSSRANGSNNRSTDQQHRFPNAVKSLIEPAAKSTKPAIPLQQGIKLTSYNTNQLYKADHNQSRHNDGDKTLVFLPYCTNKPSVIAVFTNLFTTYFSLPPFCTTPQTFLVLTG
jgi:hypothetical protein